MTTIPIFLLAATFISLTILAFAFTVRGLLGVHFTLFRLAVAGSITFLSFTPILNAMIAPDELDGQDYFPALFFFALAIAIALLLGMVFLVIAEALVPSNTLPGPIYTLRAFRRWLRRSARYSQITRIIVRHGLLAYLSGGRRAELKSPEGRSELARRLRLALNEGGVTFVKLGQILSTRRDLLPREFIEELSKLQDRAASMPWSEVEPILTAELGATVDEVFASFDREPLAAASIAQVHTAQLQTGEEVVVKVRRQGIVSQVDRDLDIVDRLARTLHRTTTWGRQIGVVDLANGFGVALREELDLRVEARNVAVVAAASRQRGDDTGLHIPVLYPDLSTSQILVMERIFGTPLNEAGPEIIRLGLDPAHLARQLLESLLRQIVIDGTFHADPHPGNVMLLSTGQLTLLDFGSVGRIDAVLRGALVRLILSFERGDPIAASDALLDLVARPEGLDEYRLERTLGQFMARYLTPGVPPDVRMFADLFRIIADFGLTVPPEVAAVFRAIATLEGTLGSIQPDFNIIGEARQFATDYMREQLHPMALRRTLTDELTDLLPMLRRLPRRVDRIASALEEGRFSVNVRGDIRPEDGLEAVKSVLLVVLAATAGIMGAIMLGNGGGPEATNSVSMYQLIGYSLLVGALILAMRVLVLIFRPGSR